MLNHRCFILECEDYRSRFQDHCQDCSQVLMLQVFEILMACLISLFNIRSMLFLNIQQKKEKPFIERHIYVRVNFFLL